jgi:hypothetical protein
MDDRVHERGTGNEQPIVETTTRARQGVTGHNVRYVLMLGLGGAVICLLIVYLALFAR